MQKYIHYSLKIFILTSTFLIFGFINIALAQPLNKLNSYSPPLSSSGTIDPSTPNLTSSQVFSIYLPIIQTPPPPSPKKGLGARKNACIDAEVLRTTWYLNWRVYPDSTCEGVDGNFVPRISKADDMARLTQAIANANGSGWLIGFTEPNLSNQSNLSPQQGAIYWRQIENAADSASIKLVSPSPSQHGPGWLWDMVVAYENIYGTKPHFDAIGWNIYKSNPNDIKTYLTARRNEALARGYNVPIWVLEYGGNCQGSLSSNRSVMAAVTPWFDSTSWIGRYAWFANRLDDFDGNSWRGCSLINTSSGVPTSLGNLYSIY